jgi:hypothetical protein
MNDLDLVQRFRADVPGPDDERAAAARALLMAEVRTAADAPVGERHGRSDRVRRRPALALRLAVPAAASLAAGAAAAIVLVGGGGSGTSTADAAIIQHAETTFAAPPHEIFHYELQGDGFIAESWQQTSAPYAYLQGKGAAGAVPWASESGTAVALYDPATNTIHQTTSTKSSAGRTVADNPLSEIQQALQDGRARVLGTPTVDNTASYEIQLADKNGFDAQSLIAYVDQASYRPLEIAVPQADGTTADLRVVAFEYLPATPANMNLLSLTARYPSAALVTDPATGGTGSGK